MLSLCIFGSASLLRADITGKIFGTVADPSGATVPGAKVTLRNSSTGLTRALQTDASGSFEFLLVPIGDGYSVEVEATGFEKGVEQGITLLVNQVFRADFSLRIGSATQKVEVSAAAAQVETTSTQVGDVIESSKMETLPLNGRSYLDLLGLQAGVAPVNSGTGYGAPAAVSGDLANAGNLSVNGQREGANSFLVNGGDVEHSFENGASLVPSLDSIAEFRLITNSYDAEYGRFSGAIVNVVTKSGTNNFHGDLYDFVRNNAMDSRNFFDYNQVSVLTGQEIPGSALGELKRNQFGGTLGGPLRKNRLFFFTDYQGTREVAGASTGNIHVPSGLERAGNFSDIGTTGYSDLTGTVQGVNTPGSFAQTLSSRLGYTVTPGEPYYTSGCNSLANAQAGLCVFPGRVIPQAAWSPAAAGTLPFIPTATLVSAGVPYFSSSAYKEVVRDDKFAVKMDLNTQHWGTWSVYYHFDDASALSPYTNGVDVPGFDATNPTRVQQINLGNTWSPNPTTVNEARVNFVRPAITTGVISPSSKGLGNISQWGFSTGGQGLVYQPGTPEGVPQINLSVTGIDFGMINPNVYHDNDYQFVDNLSKIHGRHTLKFGAEYRHLADAFRFQPVNGSFVFTGNETGNDFADYLIGAVPPDEFFEASVELEDARSKYFGAYAQDSFKIRPNVTLNYGLRYQISTPWADTLGRVTAFKPGEQSVILPNAPTGLVFPGDPGVPNTVSPTHYDDFDPRLGLAYSPGFSSGVAGKIFGGPGKSSLRASFGIFHTVFEEGSFSWATGDNPWSIWDYLPSPVYLEAPWRSRYDGSDITPPFPYVMPSKHSNFSFLNFSPVTGITTVKTDNVLPYAEHYNLTFQRALGTSTTLTVAYIGTEGHHLLGQIEANPGSPSKCLQIAALAAAAGVPGCGPYGEDEIYTIGNQTFYGTRPYSVTSGRYLDQGKLDIGGTILWAATMLNSDYNSLQATLEKRVGSMRFLGAYTYGKAMDNGSSYSSDEEDPFDYRLNRGLSAFDMTHNFVISYVYDLPFQKLARSSGPVAKLLGGWSFTGITRFTTGIPVSLKESGDLGLVGSLAATYDGVDQPDYNGQKLTYSNPRSSGTHQYFSTEQFSSMPLGGVGTANRRFFHGPGINNWDLGLHKMMKITERTSVEFRAEFFDAFNHAQFSTVQSDYANTTEFGDVTSARSPRIGQVALKLNF